MNAITTIAAVAQSVEAPVCADAQGGVLRGAAEVLSGRGEAPAFAGEQEGVGEQGGAGEMLSEMREAPAFAGERGGVGERDAVGAHHTILTPSRQAAFLENLAEFGTVRLACRAATVSPQTAYRARRRSAGFARAWDAALLSARIHAEGALAERALNGVEEAVYYHGEEIARRLRFDSRLLLAHLARLDRLEERADVAATLPLLDDQIDALRRGEALPEEAPPEHVPACSPAACCSPAASCSPTSPCFPTSSRSPLATNFRSPAKAGASGGGANRFEAPACAGEQGGEAGEQGSAGEREGAEKQARSQEQGGAGERENLSQDSVPSVPSCRECGGHCGDPDADLTEEDCMWLGNRIERMEAARPADAPRLRELGDPGAVETLQLAAFEAGLDGWWTIRSAEELDAQVTLVHAPGRGNGRDASDVGQGRETGRGG